jgi:hypothetical protein
MARQSIHEPTGETTPAPQPRFSIRRILVAGIFSLCAGFVASLPAVMLMGILRLAAGIPTPIELLGDFVLKHSLFSLNPCQETNQSATARIFQR